MALRGYTAAAADATGEQAVAGRVGAGYRADLTVFGLDPLAAPPDELAEAPIALTVTDGQVRHHGPDR